MKELIAATLFIVSLYTGTAALKLIHSTVKQAALEKAAKGLPSLSQMNKAIRSPRKSPAQ